MSEEDNETMRITRQVGGLRCHHKKMRKVRISNGRTRNKK
jgi:hypothetical protein